MSSMSSNLLFHASSVPCRVLRLRQSPCSTCTTIYPRIIQNKNYNIRSLSDSGIVRNYSRMPSHSNSLSIYTFTGESFPIRRGYSCIQTFHSKTIHSTTLFHPFHETSRNFASRRKGGGKGKKGKQETNVLSNEGLISKLIRDSGESSADQVTVRLVIDEAPDEPSSVQITSLSEAIVVSLDKELDLIGANINGDPPVIRATQLSKLEYKHQQAQKKQQQSSSNKKERKSFRFKAGIESNDLERKLDRLKGFLSKGHDCEFTVFCRLRTLRENPNAGAELVDQIRGLLSDHGDMKRPPQTNETKSFYRVQYEPKK